MEQDEAVSLWIVAPGRAELRRERLPAPAAGEVLVHACYGGVSRGTEALVFNGRVPPSEWTRMRAPFQRGDFPGPVQYGYLSVGRVVGGEPGLIGRDVFCLHPHQNRYVVPASAVLPLPEGLPPARAILAANLETAINASWDAGLAVGDRVSVVGGGCIGSLLAWLASRTPGCEVELVDINPARAAVAAALGVPFAAPAGARGGADVVFHASASEAGLAAALELAANEAMVVESSWYGEGRIPVALGAAFHSRRLRLVSSQVGQLPASHRSRWDHRRRLALALRLLAAAPELDALINSEGPFTALPARLAKLANDPGDVIMHRIVY
ncbi:MAG: zinc-binding alcohol dehydrogenase [Burkholderiaceae bacterium]